MVDRGDLKMIPVLRYDDADGEEKDFAEKQRKEEAEEERMKNDMATKSPFFFLLRPNGSIGKINKREAEDDKLWAYAENDRLSGCQALRHVMANECDDAILLLAFPTT